MWVCVCSLHVLIRTPRARVQFGTVGLHPHHPSCCFTHIEIVDIADPALREEAARVAEAEEAEADGGGHGPARGLEPEGQLPLWLRVGV